jgi:hypothetical protein
MGSGKSTGCWIISSPFKIFTSFRSGFEKSTSMHTMAIPDLVNFVTLSWILRTFPTVDAIEQMALGDCRCALRSGKPIQTGIDGL